MDLNLIGKIALETCRSSTIRLIVIAAIILSFSTPPPGAQARDVFAELNQSGKPSFEAIPEHQKGATPASGQLDKDPADRSSKPDSLPSKSKSDDLVNEEICVLVDTPRPLQDVARLLSSRYRVPVTYEDPALASTDLQEILPALSIPANVRERLTYTKGRSVGEVLRTIAEQHNTGNRGGQYAVVRSAASWCLVPVRCVGADGKLTSHRSPLEQVVTLVIKENESCLSVMDRLFEQLRKDLPDDQVYVTHHPAGLMSKVPFPRRKIDATARDVINEVLELMNGEVDDHESVLNWHMSYSPASNGHRSCWMFGFSQVAIRPTRSYAMLIEAARPVASAAEILQGLHSVRISYEEPPLKCSCDVLGTIGSGKAALAGGMIRLEWDAKQNEIENLLTLLTKSAIAPRDPAGMFGYESSLAGGFHLFPLKGRDAVGDLRPATTLLAQQIEVSTLKDSVSAVLGDCVARALSVDAIDVQARGDNARELIRQPLPKTVAMPKQKAKDMIDGYLGLVDRKLSWQLQFDPSLGSYKLVIYNP